MNANQGEIEMMYLTDPLDEIETCEHINVDEVETESGFVEVCTDCGEIISDDATFDYIIALLEKDNG